MTWGNDREIEKSQLLYAIQESLKRMNSGGIKIRIISLDNSAGSIGKGKTEIILYILRCASKIVSSPNQN